MYKPPYLQKYAGKTTRFTCPGCKTPFSFTRYLDGETHQPIHPTVGRCNREIKCGYHYTPRQYFEDLNHQYLNVPILQHQVSKHSDHHFLIANHDRPSNQNPDSATTHQHCRVHSQSNNLSQIQTPQCPPDYIKNHSNFPKHQKPGPMVSKQNTSHHKEQPTGAYSKYLYPEPLDPFLNPQLNQLGKPPDYIPIKYLKRSLSLNSNFVQFLRKYFSDLQITEAATNYLLGATKKREVIFWQIDIDGKVRTGKIMKYNPQTGRRFKTGYGGINWVHHKLKKSNPSFSDFNLSQCYFGEHLLRLYPNKPVAIVEAEKTAVIASMIFHDYNWLAAGNLNGLNSEKSKVLQNKTVILYPDADCYDKWKNKMNQIKNDINCQIHVSDLIETHVTTQQSHDSYDIADYILEQLEETKIANNVSILIPVKPKL